MNNIAQNEQVYSHYEIKYKYFSKREQLKKKLYQSMVYILYGIELYEEKTLKAAIGKKNYVIDHAAYNNNKSFQYKKF